MYLLVVWNYNDGKNDGIGSFDNAYRVYLIERKLEKNYNFNFCVIW